MLCKFARANLQIKLCRFITLSPEVGLPPDLPRNASKLPSRAKTRAPDARNAHELRIVGKERVTLVWPPQQHARPMSNARKFRLPANLTVIANMRATGNARLPGHEHMTPQHNIMRKMHQIIELAALADNCVAQRAAINGTIGPHFDIGLNDDAAKLGHFYMRLARREAKTALPDAAARMNDNRSPIKL